MAYFFAGCLLELYTRLPGCRQQSDGCLVESSRLYEPVPLDSQNTTRVYKSRSSPVIEKCSIRNLFNVKFSGDACIQFLKCALFKARVIQSSKRPFTARIFNRGD